MTAFLYDPPSAISHSDQQIDDQLLEKGWTILDNAFQQFRTKGRLHSLIGRLNLLLWRISFG
ncbi:hypothetical protein [Zymomonas mobilis]|uniref:hypothetical protein n=1 Tax=Zymomonas mobilis TaxID=542 RepID=UPI0013967349|nr:hypothetical protein [Zymomonas mobilis]UBQ08787.1 hypothetical protein LB319_09735 [Zymomonas mobilis]